MAETGAGAHHPQVIKDNKVDKAGKGTVLPVHLTALLLANGKRLYRQPIVVLCDYFLMM